MRRADRLFDIIQILRRGKVVRAADIARATALHPVTYMAFDLISCLGRDLRGFPVMVRKHLLKQALESAQLEGAELRVPVLVELQVTRRVGDGLKDLHVELALRVGAEFLQDLRLQA